MAIRQDGGDDDDGDPARMPLVSGVYVLDPFQPMSTIRSGRRCGRFLLLLCVLATSLMAAAAQAQITVSRSVIEFSPDNRIQDVEITNSGEVTMYVEAKPAEIVAPHTDEPVRQELDDPRTAPLIVSPRQLMIPPGERKRLRMILRDATLDQERVFRLAITPYVGKVRIGERGEAGTSSAIKVLVGYDLLLLARPQPLAPKLDVSRTDEAIEFVNSGNTNVLLRTIKQCDADGEDCVDLQSDRLYVGQTMRLTLPKIGTAEQFPVEVYRSVGLENFRESY